MEDLKNQLVKLFAVPYVLQQLLAEGNILLDSIELRAIAEDMQAEVTLVVSDCFEVLTSPTSTTHDKINSMKIQICNLRFVCSFLVFIALWGVRRGLEMILAIWLLNVLT